MKNKIYILVEATYDYHEFLNNIGVDSDKDKLIERCKDLSKYDYIDLSNVSDKAKKKFRDDEECHCYIEEWELV